MVCAQEVRHPEWWPDGYQKHIDAENHACYNPGKVCHTSGIFLHALIDSTSIYEKCALHRMTAMALEKISHYSRCEVGL